MPIDTSMYNGRSAADLMGGYREGLSMKRMASQDAEIERQRLEEQATRDAFKNNMTVGPDGQPVLDRKMAISDLARVNGAKAYEQGQAFQQQDAAAAKMKREKAAQDAELIGRVAGSIRDQASYEQGLAALQQSGVDTSGMPRQYDPRLVNGYRMKAMSVAEQFAQENKQREMRLKEQEFGIRNRENGSGGVTSKGMSPGQKKVDTDFAPDYNDWTSGQSDSARAEIQKLSAVADKLSKKEVTTGGTTGMWPDRLTSNKILSARADVESTIMKSLRSIMGAAFTEKEGQRVINNTWNEADSTENNQARLNRLVQDLVAQADAKDAKARYYEERGTLAGFKPSTMSQQKQAAANPSKTFKTNEIQWKD